MFKRDNKQIEITVSNRTILRIIAFIIGSALVLRIFDNLVHPLTLIFVSFFLAMALNPIVTKLSHRMKSRSRSGATALAYIAVMSVLITFFALFFPPLFRQTADFIGDIPQTLRDVEQDEGAIGNLVRRYNLEEQITDFANSWSSDLGSFSGDAVNVASRVVSNLVSIITVLVLTFMMLVDGPRMLAGIWKLYPQEKRKHAQMITRKMYKVVTSYVVGQVFVAAIGATFAIVALFIMTAIFDVSNVNAVALGGIIFLFSLIPTIGTIIGASIVVLFCLFASVPLAIAMIVYFIIYQQIENVTIQPIIQSRGIELTPMLVFIAAILGIGVAGPLGAVIAIPIAGCVKVLFDDYVERRGLVRDNEKDN